MLEVRELSCFVGERRLFSPVDFFLSSGGMLQLRGENGAGKSTLLRCIVGLPAKYEGNITRPDEITYIGHQHMLHPDLTVAQNLDFFSIKLDTFDYFLVNDFLHCKVRELSAGQKQRVSLSRLRSVVNRLWVLDEPFVNLDPDGKQILVMAIQQHLQGKGAVLLANHESLGFGEQICLA